jgi:hypothetical protein
MEALMGTNVDLEIGGVNTPGGADGLGVGLSTFEDDIRVRAHFLHRNKCLKLGQGTQGAGAMTPGSSVPVSVPDSAVLTPGTSASSSLRVKRKDPSDLRSNIDNFTASTSGLVSRHLDLKMARIKVKKLKLDERMQANRHKHLERMTQMQIQMAQIASGAPPGQVSHLHAGALPAQLAHLHAGALLAQLAHLHAGALPGQLAPLNLTHTSIPPTAQADA